MRKNAGYEIVNKVFTADSNLIVLGHNPDAVQSYVTWLYNPKTNTYVHGHYFKTYDDAVDDMLKRHRKAIKGWD